MYETGVVKVIETLSCPVQLFAAFLVEEFAEIVKSRTSSSLLV